MVNPVTVTADVAVKKDSQIPTSFEEQIGVESKKVPIKTTSKPVKRVNCGTVNLLYQASFKLIFFEKDTE